MAYICFNCHFGIFSVVFSMDYDLFAKCCQVLGLASEIIFLLEVGGHKW